MGASSNDPLGSGRYGTTAAWKCPLSSGGPVPESGRTNGARAGLGPRVATPTTSAVLRACSGSDVSESQSRAWVCANTSIPPGMPTGDRLRAVPTSPAVSPTSTTPTVSLSAVRERGLGKLAQRSGRVVRAPPSTRSGPSSPLLFTEKAMP